ncbi:MULTISPECIES: ABC transporter substrate-binding protein [unclassified Motilimonas]|uniref:ABC transporter substrate-binding protein n=1 Tax=Motilimonas TaxID=1914248 RepID=UPI001E3A1066|nr:MULTISPECIES: ABC transporter substrate-binding protein [unclassified Motilimonas]MCE0557636.1 ABC transporter substrate-binding protein [Motilimonas sp. E26]MDO6526313.1 ABC transporter substrate-binding protein [Motilimonas sp. 1_MG-2023]
MKKLIIAAAMMLTVAGSVHAKEWKNVRIGIEGAYPPFSWTEPNGEVKGFDIDIANALCEEMKVKCTLVKQDWDGIIPALLARKYDAIIATMDITEERKKKVAFSDKYQHIPARFAAKKGTAIELTAEFMSDKRIGVQRATSMDTYVTDNFPKAQVKRYGTADEAYLDLKSGRLDYVMIDSAAISDGLLNKPGGDAFEFVGPKLNDPRWFGEGAGIAMRKNDTELKAKFDAAIKAIRANGKYKELQDKYFDFDVYGD